MEGLNQEFQAGVELESDLTYGDDGGNSNTPEKDHFEMLVKKVEDDAACKLQINSEMMENFN